MAKVGSTYASLVKGVSQQAPADRLEGQHGEVLNMLSDPVRGLVRRNGTVIEHQQFQNISGSTTDATKDSFSFRTYSYQADALKIDLIYRSRPKIGSGSNHLSGLMVYDKTPITGAGFVEVVSDPGDVSAINTIFNGGISAVQSLSSYVIFAARGVSPSYAVEDQLTGQAWSASGVAWVRGGAYARTYTIKATKASTGVQYTATYTTMAAMTDEILDTSGISDSDPDYQKQINDMTYAYNSAVNQWIREASQDIVPSNIAQELIDGLTAAGFAGWTRNGAHFGSTDVSFIEVNDGGDGSLLVALLNQTSAADEVTDHHYIGKVVRVQPRTNLAEAFYLKAYARDGSEAATGIRPVIWREAAGVIQTPTNIFAIGILYEGTFYLASSPAMLASLVEDETGDELEVPQYVDSVAGDTDSAAPPAFYGKYISALALFQDRLLVFSGSTVTASRPGDYFNFYRSSALTVQDDDPVEKYALGTESDTIRQALVYDRNLIAYGDDYHYTINGRVPFTATQGTIAVQFVMAQTGNARPVSVGNFVFSLKEDTQLGSSRLMQTNAGVYQDTPELIDVSRQLRDYVNGTPAEIVALSNPEVVFVRTEHFLKSQGAFPRARPWGLYVYQYLDKPGGERIVDAWSAWEWSSALGTPIGISATGTSDGLMIYTLAWGRNQAGTQVRGILAMSASARPDPTGLPYLDGMRRAEVADDTGLLTNNAATSVRNVTYTAAGALHSYEAVLQTSDADRFTGLEHPHYTVGDGPPEAVDLHRWSGIRGNQQQYLAAFPSSFADDLWTGTAFPAYVDLTSPFVRDRNGKAKEGKLTLQKLLVTLMRASGFEATYIDHITAKTAKHFAGDYRRIDYDVSVWIGRDAKHVQVRLAAKDWYPLTINAVKWSGQWFESK